MEAENSPEANTNDQPATEDTTVVKQEDQPKTNGETTPETIAMPSPAKARCVTQVHLFVHYYYYSAVGMTGIKQRPML